MTFCRLSPNRFDAGFQAFLVSFPLESRISESLALNFTKVPPLGLLTSENPHSSKVLASNFLKNFVLRDSFRCHLEEKISFRSQFSWIRSVGNQTDSFPDSINTLSSLKTVRTARIRAPVNEFFGDEPLQIFDWLRPWTQSAFETYHCHRFDGNFKTLYPSVYSVSICIKNGEFLPLEFFSR
jgi:hypothetical protein